MPRRRSGSTRRRPIPRWTPGLLEVGARVEFAHPLVRSAAYRSAAADDRHRVHRALADATDAEADPDRRAWHRARATRRTRRGGRRRARAFGEPGTGTRRARRRRRVPRAGGGAHSRARATCRAGAGGGSEQASRGSAAGRAATALPRAAAGPLDELGDARAQLLRAQIAFVTTRGREAPPLLLDAARRLESLDPALARETYIDAFAAAVFAGRLAQSGDVREIAAAVLAANGPTPPRRTRAPAISCSTASRISRRMATRPAIPGMRRAVDAFVREPMPDEDALRWLWLARHTARTLGDDASWDELTARQVDVARRSGALSMLPAALHERFRVELYSGNLAAATALAEEANATIDAIGSHERPHGALVLAAWCGREDEAVALVEAGRDEVSKRGEGMWLIGSHWTLAELFNGLGRWEDALRAAEWVAEQPNELGSSTWIAVELIEAAARSGEVDRAAAALDRFSEMARATGTDWALGIEARSRALLSDGAEADDAYREAIERLGRTRIRVDARARASRVRRVAPARESPRRRARRAAAGARHVRGDGIRAVRRAGAPRAGRDGREGAQAQRRDARRADPPGGADRPARRDGLSNPEIGASSSSARAPSSGTCARCSRSSASARAGSSGRRLPRTGCPFERLGPGGRRDFHGRDARWGR